MITDTFSMPVIFVVSIITGFLIGSKLSKDLYHLQVKLHKFFKVKKYHIHHDFVGLALMFISFFSPLVALGVVLSGIGFGLLTHHLLTEGVKLITKK